MEADRGETGARSPNDRLAPLIVEDGSPVTPQCLDYARPSEVLPA